MKYVTFLLLTGPCLWVYGDFGECSVTCGMGVRKRFPIITQQASNGGYCPDFVIRGIADEEICIEEDCPGDKTKSPVAIMC